MRAMSHRRPLIFAAAALVLGIAGLTAAWAALNRGDDQAARATTSPTPSSTTIFLDVTVDPSGHPYDVALGSGAKVERRPLAILHAPSRRVLFLGGEATPYVKAGEYEPVTLAERPERRYPVHAIWVREARYDSIVGVVIVERDTPVFRWQQLQRAAYGTDGGVGGITTVEWAARPKELENVVSRLYDEELIERSRQSFTADVDGHEGVDTIVFANGFGDGGFPSIAGYDASGARAEIVLWTIAAPWRLAFPTGTPPPEVTRREKTLAACLDGRRTVELGMRCRLSR